MEEITFSVFNHGSTAIENMRGLLKEFEARENLAERLQVSLKQSL